ncbi:MAG: TOBE domain-containing protein, partial [Chloroflexi bacterium]|nr:TOBE domain-containing protein [Chloroflexota bacterium]
FAKECGAEAAALPTMIEEARIELDARFPLVSLITKQSLEELSLCAGSRVVASFKATAVHLIPRHVRPQPPSG